MMSSRSGYHPDTPHDASSIRSSADPRRPRLRVVPPADGADSQSIEIGPLDLELGGRLPNVTLAYRTWGQLNERRDNAVIVLHALTGDTQATGEQGWWTPIIGPGRPINTDERFVLCVNVLGGCAGSTGPTSIDPLTGRPYAMRFPLVTIGDMVTAQRKLIDHLGITGLIAIGGSIGGLQALEWATRHPELVCAAVPIAATGTLGPQGIALHGEIGRRAIMADPDWRGGNYLAEGTFPRQGLAIARMMGMVTYHSQESMEMRFGRNAATRPGTYPTFGPTYDVEGYLHYQGEKLADRFDANSYLYLTRAMDLYDVGRDGGEARWLSQIAAPMLLIGIRSDWLFPPDQIAQLGERGRALGKAVRYVEIDSPHGHDAFLKEWEQLDDILRSFLDQTVSHAIPTTSATASP